MKIHQIILEGISDIVYHFTMSTNALEILKSGEFSLAPNIKNQAEAERGKSYEYFLSTTRSRRGAFHAGRFGGVLFKLNGQKLSQRFKGMPLDYYQWGSDISYSQRAKSDEMEDRIFSPTREIPSIPYMYEVSILHISGDPNTVPIYVFCRKNGIPVKVYSDRTSFLRGKDGLSHQEIMGLKTKQNPHKSFRTFSKYAVQSIIRLIELLYVNDYRKLTKDTREFYLQTVRSHDATSSIQNEIHNAYDSKKLDHLTKYMKQHKINNLKELIINIREKFEPQIKKIEDEHRRQIWVKQYEKNKQFYDHINDVVAGDAEFNKEAYGGKEHIRFIIEDGIYLLHNIGILKNKNFIEQRSGYADSIMVVSKFGVH